MIKTVELQTAQGEKVTNVELPNELKTMPDVIVWGTRVFLHRGTVLYREASNPYFTADK
jgi:hypothetical protein